jgi:hypothetical protein
MALNAVRRGSLDLSDERRDRPGCRSLDHEMHVLVHAIDRMHDAAQRNRLLNDRAIEGITNPG